MYYTQSLLKQKTREVYNSVNRTKKIRQLTRQSARIIHIIENYVLIERANYRPIDNYILAGYALFVVIRRINEKLTHVRRYTDCDNT